ncbi:UDP-N-acetylmuramoylalanine--D-glutamate ligase [bacterium HR08]|nr:UDP-N-acetylmuramoylalanine--D-glutamate ligase [bacterium HR08]
MSVDVRGKTIVVMGLGESGVAASEFLARRGARVIATDAKTEAELGRAREHLATLRALGVEIVLGGHPPELLRAAEAIVVSPGVPPTLAALEEARRAGVPIIGEVELAARFLKGTLIGVTGTNGKTTVTAWIGDLLARCGYCAHVGGNIGRALVRVIEEVHDARCCVVAELSSFQLETVETLHPRVAVVTNIAPDHLNRHGSLEAYIAAKRRIFRHQTEADWAVLNADDPTVRAMAEATRARVLFFSRQADARIERGVFLRGEEIVLRWEEQERVLAHRSDVPLRGLHNVENALAAIGAMLVGASLMDSRDEPEARPFALARALPVREALRAFPGVEHRLEWVARIEGVDYYNDSKATNVASTLVALEALDGPLVLILGGRDKGDDFTRLRPAVAERAAHVLVLGEAAEKIRVALEDVVPVTRCATLEEAVHAARRLARPGMAVVLSPACASFDMFENFEHRGRVFKEAVRRLAEESSAASREGGDRW